MTDLATTFGQKFTKLKQFGIGTSAAESNKRTIKDLAYKAFIVASQDDVPIVVEAWLPETVGSDVKAEYEAPFAQGVSNALGANVGDMARFVGMSLTTQALTAKVWQGGNFIEFSLPFIFQAESSPSKDVMTPIKNLMKLTMPKDRNGGGLLEAPGPRIDLDELAKRGGESVTKLSGALTSGLTNPGKMLDSAKELVSNPLGTLKRVRDGFKDISKPLSTALVNSVKNNISLYIGQFQYFPCVVITDVSPTYDVIIGPDFNPIRATVNVSFSTYYVPTDRDIETMFPAVKRTE
jgi:hypothetical protein